MDVAGRREAADVADVVLVAADQVQVDVEQLLALDALDDAEDAPGQVVVVWPGRQTRATIENDPSGSTWRVWAR
jgi:nitrate reductase NapAB chaperone NapD